MGQDLAEESLRPLVRGRREKLVGRRLFDDFAIGHEDHAIGDRARKAHLMGHAHHGHAIGGEADHGVEHLLDHLRIERRGRLVEQHDLGVHAQRTRNGHALLLAAGELGGILIRLCADLHAVEQPHRRRARLVPGNAPDLQRREHAVVQHGHVREQIELLEHHADFHAHRIDIPAAGGQIDAIDHDGAALHRLQLIDASHQCRLSGAGRPAQHDALAVRDPEVDVLQGVKAAVVFIDAIHHDGGLCIGCRHGVSCGLLHGEGNAFDLGREVRQRLADPLLADRSQFTARLDLVDRLVQPDVEILLAGLGGNAHPLLVEHQLLLEVVVREDLVDVEHVGGVGSDGVHLPGDQALDRGRIVIETADVCRLRQAVGDGRILGGPTCHADAQPGGVLELLDLLPLLGEHDDLQAGIGLTELHHPGALRIHPHGRQQHVDLAGHHLRDARCDRHADELDLDAHLAGQQLADIDVIAGKLARGIEIAPRRQFRQHTDPDHAALLDLVDGLGARPLRRQRSQPEHDQRGRADERTAMKVPLHCISSLVDFLMLIDSWNLGLLASCGRQATFHRASQPRQRPADNEIDQADDGVDQQRPVGDVGQQRSGARQFGETDDRRQRRALDQLDQESDGRRQRDLQRLRQDDVTHPRPVVEAERPRGLGLAARDRLDRAAPDFAEEGAGVQHEGNRHRDPRTDRDVEQPDAIIDDEQLQQQRRAAEDLDERAGHPLQRTHAAGPAERHGEAAEAAEREADGGERKRPQRADQQQVELSGAERRDHRALIAPDTRSWRARSARTAWRARKTSPDRARRW